MHTVTQQRPGMARAGALIGTDVAEWSRSMAAKAVALYAFTIPFQRSFSVAGLGSPATIAGAIALVFGVLALALAGRRHRLHPVILAGAGLALLTVLSLAWSPMPTDGFGPGLRALGPDTARTAVQLVVTLWLIWEFIDRQYLRVRVFVTYVLGAHIASAVAFREWLDVGSSQLRITGGEAILPNPQALTLALAIPLAWYSFVRMRQPVVRVAMLAYMPVGSVAVLLTGSRTGALALVLGLLIIPLSLRELPAAWRSMTIVALIATMPFVPGLLPDDTLGRALSSSEQVDLEANVEERDEFRTVGFDVFLDHPFVGSGVGAVRQRFAEEKPGFDTRFSSHNSPLNVAAELGVFAFGLFVFMFVATFTSMFGGRWLEGLTAVLMFAMVGIVMQFVNLEFHKTTWLTIGLLLVNGRPFAEDDL